MSGDGEKKKKQEPPKYPSSEELFSSDVDEEQQPFPLDRNFPPKNFFINENWSQEEENEWRQLVQENVLEIRFRDGLAGYDQAVIAEKMYWRDRTQRDRLTRAQPSAQPEITLPELTENEVQYYAKPEGKISF